MYATPNPTQQSVCAVPVPTQPQHNIQQQQNLAVPVTTNNNNNRSLTLIGFGISQLTVSFILLCVWVITLYDDVEHNYVTILCSVYHAILSILAILGGRDVVRHRCLIGVCMGLAIIGASVIATVTIGIYASSWFNVNTRCHRNCVSGSYYNDINNGYNSRSNLCDRICINTRLLVVPVILCISAQILLDITISIVNCFEICRCCSAKRHSVSPNQITQPQFYLQPNYIPQPILNNSPYSIQQPPANLTQNQQSPNYDLLAQQANAVNA